MRAHPAVRFALSLSITASALLAQTTYVVAKGTTYPEILSALQVAVAGDIIEVDEIDPATPGQAARYLPFHVDKTLTIRRRNPFSLARPVVDATGFQVGVLIDTQAGPATVIDGLEIRNAGAHGIRIDAVSPTLRNCVIASCGFPLDGGGVYLAQSSASLEGCQIVDCDGNKGAGAYCYESNVRFVGCEFGDNVANADGGGIAVEGTFAVQPTTIVEECSFVDNVTYGSGGGISHDSGLLVVRRSSFQGNEASNGGGIYMREATLRLDYGFLDQNRATSEGGGIFAGGCTGNVIANTQFVGNQASGDGGGLKLAFESQAGTWVQNCSFDGNQGWSGGAMAFESAPVRLTNVTCHANAAIAPQSGNGGAIYSFGALVQVESSILWNNTATVGGQPVALQEIFADSIQVEYSVWRGANSVPALAGYNPLTCIDADPLFVAGPVRPYQPFQGLYLDPTSPAVDAGNPADTPDGVETTDALLAPDAPPIDMGYHRDALPLPDAVLTTDVVGVSLATGGSAILSYDHRLAPPQLPTQTRWYLIGGSMTGTQPGIALGGIVLPVAFDAFTLAHLNGAGPYHDTLTGARVVWSPVHPGGVSTFELRVPAGLPVSLVGASVYTACALLEFDTATGANTTFSMPSNPVRVTLQ